MRGVFTLSVSRGIGKLCCAAEKCDFPCASDLFPAFPAVLTAAKNARIKEFFMNQKAFHAMSYGVYIVSTWDNGRPTGCTANCAAQITSSPATVMVSINKDNYTNKCIADCGHFAISVLSENSDPAIIGTFGFRSGKDVNKFDSVAYAVKDTLPVVSDSCAYIACRVINTMDSPTHTVFLGEVIGADVTSENKPMTYAYYHGVIKGKTAKNAPTYIEEEKQAGKYTCSVCGYEYSGNSPFEELPDDWTCPVCGQPKSVFRKS